MKATLADPKILKSSIDAISNMIDEASIVANPDGLALRAMDPAHVALVDFKMEKDAFEEYDVHEMLTLGIDLDRLNTILKRAGSSDRIELSVSDDGSALRITIRNSATRRFDLPLIDVGEEELRVPQLEFPARVEIDPKILSEGIKDAEIVSDHVTLRCDSENVYISASGDLGNVEVKVSREQAVSFEVSEPCKSMFSIEYLKDMIKAGDIASTVRINLGNDIPVKLDFLAPGVALSFLLAPRIESE
ncbi:proliferating cell nuclear antigen (pcna) [Candidatus Pyrohabitans sp.]